MPRCLVPENPTIRSCCGTGKWCAPHSRRHGHFTACTLSAFASLEHVGVGSCQLALPISGGKVDNMLRLTRRCWAEVRVA